MAREDRVRVTFETIEKGRLLVTLLDPTGGPCTTTITPFSASVATRCNDDGEVMMSVVIGDEWPGSMPNEWPCVEVSTFANGQYSLNTKLPVEADGWDALNAVDRVLFMLRVLGECDLNLSYNARADIDRSVEETFALRGKVSEAVRRMEDKLSEESVGEIERVYRLIEAADRRRDEMVLCLLGAPGIGKTESVERFARDHHRNVVHIIASQIMPNEVSGMTMPNQETHSMEIFDHEKLGHLRDGDIIFFDELLKGQQQVLNACLTLIQERRLMSGKRLPDVLIVAAANPLGSAKQLPIEIRQRFLFVNVDWDSKEWSRYMRETHGITPTEGMVRDLEDAYSVYSKGESNTWNTLTPRTATKLMLWVDSVHEDKVLMSSVSMEIGEAFGTNVMNDVVQSVMDKYDVTRKFVSGISEILREVRVTDETVDERVRDIEDDGLSKDTIQRLIDSLMALDEWPEISKRLESVSLDEIEF